MLAGKVRTAPRWFAAETEAQLQQLGFAGWLKRLTAGPAVVSDEALAPNCPVWSQRRRADSPPKGAPGGDLSFSRSRSPFQSHCERRAFCYPRPTPSHTPTATPTSCQAKLAGLFHFCVASSSHSQQQRRQQQNAGPAAAVPRVL